MCRSVRGGGVILYYILLLLTPFWNYPKLPKFGETFTTVKIVGIAVLVCAVVKATAARKPSRWLVWTESRLYILFMVLVVLSASMVSSGGWASAPLQQYASVALYIYTTLAFVDNPERLRRSLWMILLGMDLAAYSVFSGYFRYGVSRPGGVVGDCNYYALMAVSFLPFAYFLLPGAGKRERVFLCGSGLLLIASVLLTQSRGGLLMLGFCLMYIAFRTGRRVRFAVLACAVVPVLVWVLPQSGFDRLLPGHASTEISDTYRREVLNAGLSMIAKHPLRGVGIGMFRPSSPVYNPALDGEAALGHNTYVELAAELGVAGLGLFMAIQIWAWRRAGHIARTSRAAEDRLVPDVARALEIAIASFAFGAVFLSAAYTRSFWLLIALGLAVARLARARRVSGPRAVEPIDQAIPVSCV